MSSASLTILLLLSDAFGSALAWRMVYFLRYESGMFTKPLPYEVVGPMVLLAVGWWCLFGLRGLYHQPISLSRFEELERVLKAVLIGIGLLFVATFDSGENLTPTRVVLLTYGVLVLVFVGAGRVAIRTLERKLRNSRKGLRDALIIGFNETGRKLHSQLYHYPVWGFNVVGFIDDMNRDGRSFDVPVLGGLEDLPRLVEANNVGWILVAPISEPVQALSAVLDRCGSLKVRFMLVADHYHMVVGLVRTLEIHGLPLIEVHPQLVSFETRFIKRGLDIVISFFACIVLALITPIIAIIMKFDSPGPVFYSQMRLGRKGKPFRLYKFRSMVQDAEKNSGAVWAVKNDPRVTRFGWFLRKSHLDEVPQFFNVLLGEMALVGPRPERKEFVEELRKQIPLYERRLRVRPGITGWAQVRHRYDQTVEDVAEKTRYDLFYIDHISIGLDLRILFSTVLTMLRGEGHA